MAQQGVIPWRLATCPIPVCSSCMYSKATKRQWRYKTAKNDKQGKMELHPGDVVSVDQLVSPTPGLIAQMTRFLMRKRYKYVTVFVDNASQLSYVYLQKMAIVEETLQGKRAFEKYGEGRGVTVKAYPADNRIFKAKVWVEDCRANGQALTFAGMNAHH